MTDNDGQKEFSEAAENAGSKPGEPRVSKPYIMPDEPEETPSEALVKEAAEAKDKMLRTLAEMENLRKRTQREVADARAYGIAFRMGELEPQLPVGTDLNLVVEPRVDCWEGRTRVDLVVVDVARCSDEPFAAGSPGGANGQFRRR